MTTEKPQKRPASYLSVPDFQRLNWACIPIREAFGEPPYLVGSVLTRPDFRDIDIRLILADNVMDRMLCHAGFGHHDSGDPARVRLLLNGHVEFTHQCTEGAVAATLPMPPWHVESMEPLHVEPSVDCKKCGWHDWIGGPWVEIQPAEVSP